MSRRGMGRSGLSYCHPRACPGDPASPATRHPKRDGRDKPGHDGSFLYHVRLLRRHGRSAINGSESGLRAMTQTSNRIFDEMARLMNDAAGVAQGVRREFDTLFRTQAERILRDLDVVQREEFEAVKEMARLAREENEALKARIAALEAKAEKPGRKSKDSAAD